VAGSRGPLRVGEDGDYFAEPKFITDGELQLWIDIRAVLPTRWVHRVEDTVTHCRRFRRRQGLRRPSDPTWLDARRHQHGQHRGSEEQHTQMPTLHSGHGSLIDIDKKVLAPLDDSTRTEGFRPAACGTLAGSSATASGIEFKIPHSASE
jgi:hypothetical protein